MEPKKPLWKLDPHTLGKHLVLKNYLDAWFPIMGTTNRRILFIDGFAGPGQYENGEFGSPIIAARSLAEHRAKSDISAEVVFMFIEKDPDRAAYLQNLLHNCGLSLPANSKVTVIPGIFDETMTQVLNALDAQAKESAPCFVMIDPFGVSGTPMSVIKRILRNPKSEVYISFMYESINRFKGTPEFEPHLNQLFGTPDWRHGLAIKDPECTKQFFYGLYETQLRRSGAKHVVHFDLYQGQRLVYAVFFGTHHHKGCDRMKQAIWKVAPFGDFAFRASRSGQLPLGLENPDFSPLKTALQSKFRQAGWISVADVIEFVASDKTDYHSGQVKRVLKLMEVAREIEVQDGTRERKNTYPDGTKLRFL